MKSAAVVSGDRFYRCKLKYYIILDRRWNYKKHGLDYFYVRLSVCAHYLNIFSIWFSCCFACSSSCSTKKLTGLISEDDNICSGTVASSTDPLDTECIPVMKKKKTRKTKAQRRLSKDNEGLYPKFSLFSSSFYLKKEKSSFANQ